MKYITAFILLMFLLLASSCNVQKKVAKYNEDVKRGIASYIDQHPCINDTITETKSDTVTATVQSIDTVYEKINDTVTTIITKTNTVYKTIKDTLTKVITDNRLVNFWKDSANNVNRSKEVQGEHLAAVTIESNDWKHSARNRLYLLIGVCAVFGIWTFRKPLMALLA